MNDLERELIAMLNEDARHAPQAAGVPPGVVHRVRRRQVSTVLLGCLAVLALAVLSLAGLHAVRGVPEPATTPKPTPHTVRLPGNGPIDVAGNPTGSSDQSLLQIDPLTGKSIGFLPHTGLGRHLSGLWDEDWSPDGTRLVYVTGVVALDCPPSACGVFIRDVATGQTRQLIRGADEVTAVAWSPDGTRIAYVQDSWPSSLAPHGPSPACPTDWPRTLCGTHIYVMTSSGKRVGTVNLGDHLADSVSWSPDSSQIVFADPPYASGVGHVYVASLNGSAPRLLVQGSDPAWSPDGTQIAFRRGCGIWVSNVNGSGSTQVADVGAASITALEPADATATDCSAANADSEGAPQMQPVWSPDGRFLAVALQDYQVLVIDGNGANPRVLPPAGRDVGELNGLGPPTWQPVR